MSEYLPKGSQKTGHCVVPGCTTKRYAKNMCKMHYCRTLTGIPLEREKYQREIKEKPGCLAEGCIHPAAAKGVCKAHYYHLVRGHELKPLKHHVRREKNPNGRTCTECGVYKPWSEYYEYKTGRRKGQKFAKCKPCTLKKNAMDSR